MEKTNDYLLAFFMLIGGVGLFLFGMEALVRMFKDATGPAMRRAMGRVAGRQWAGWLVGTGASALIHSAPSVVILMGLASAGLIRVGASMGLVAGANFGTTLAIQIIAFDIGRYSLGLIGAGMVLRIVRKTRAATHVSLGLVGFGLVFLGLSTVKASMAPFQDSPLLLQAMGLLSSGSLLSIPLGVLFGLLLTVLLQSSGAAVSILFSLGAVGLLPDIGAMVPMLLGIQVGKCMPALYAVLGNTLESLQVAMAHLGFNLVAVVVGVSTLPLAQAFIPLTTEDPIRQIANYNSVLMLATSLVMTPFAGAAGRWIERLTQKSPRPRSQPSFLDPKLVPYPEQALAACVQELRREGALTREMLERTLDGMVSLDRRNFAVIERLEESVASIREEMNEYLHLVGGRRLSPRQVLMLQHVARMASALKRIGDHIRHLVELCHRKFDERLWFDDEDMHRLLDLSLRATRMLATTLDSLDPYQPDQAEVAQVILDQRRDYRAASKAAREAFNATLPEEGGEGRSALMYIHFVTIFDKIVSHVKEIARQESNWSWRLRESKLVVLKPEAAPHPTTPKGAIIDPDYQAAVKRILQQSPEAGVGEPDPDTP